MQNLIYTGQQYLLMGKLLRGLQIYKEYSKIACAQAINNSYKGSNPQCVFQALRTVTNTATGQPRGWSRGVQLGKVMPLLGRDWPERMSFSSMIRFRARAIGPWHSFGSVEEREINFGVGSRGWTVQGRATLLPKLSGLRARIYLSWKIPL
jgi:hypothetical protein